jgi:hypothetical protein
MQNNGELDRTIDSALAAYSDAEPLAGLEERVLYRVREAEAGRRRVFGWAIALVAAATLVVPVVVVRAPRHTESKTYVVGIPAIKQSVPVSAETRVAVKQRTKSHAARKRRLPKEEHFPAPAPMTGEERALLAFVRQNPVDAQQLLAELQKRSDEPIDIQPIQIPPLQSDGGQ